MQSNQQLTSGFVAEYVPQNYFQALNIESVFPSVAPLEVDLGCGDGLFLVGLAKQNPLRNFLGIERLLGRVRTASQKIARENLDNARVLRIENSYAVGYLLPPGSVTVFYLLFPDPWPKRRHQGRRIVTEEFLEAIHRALVPDGMFVIATDEREYFGEICQRSEKISKFAMATAENLVLPTTTFEKHFRKRGLEIHRLILRKVSPIESERAVQPFWQNLNSSANKTIAPTTENEG